MAARLVTPARSTSQRAVIKRIHGSSPAVKAKLFYVGRPQIVKRIKSCEINRIMFLVGTTVTYALGELAGGTTATATIVIIPTVTGNVMNSASIASLESDPDSTNYTATTTTTVNQANDDSDGERYLPVDASSRSDRGGTFWANLNFMLEGWRDTKRARQLVSRAFG